MCACNSHGAGLVARGWQDATKDVKVSGIQRSVAHAISSLQARMLSQVRLFTGGILPAGHPQQSSEPDCWRPTGPQVR
jgi:hypothetical protein